MPDQSHVLTLSMQKVNMYLNHSNLRLMAISLLFTSSIAACSSIQAQETGPPAAKLPSSDGSGGLLYQGRLQTYYLHAPKSYQPDRPMPLVMVFHGSRSSGRAIANVTRFDTVADQKGFIVVYPDGINGRWNQVKHYSSSQVDKNNASFIVALIEHLQKIRNVDRQRIYATGFSSGAILTQTLACNLSERIAAFASVAGTLPVNVAASCKPPTPVSLLMINGKGDESVPYPGGKVDDVREVLSVPKTAEIWRQHNGCALNAKKVEPLANIASDQSSKVEISHYSGCHGGSEVMLISVEGIGHLWPGSASEKAKQAQSNVNAINASQTIWNFFQRHALP